MSMHSPCPIAIIGSGLAGTVLAMFLARSGKQIFICDKNVDPRIRYPSRGRSINLTLTLRGLSAFSDLGIEAEVLRNAVPLKKRVVHYNASLHEHPYSAKGNPAACLYSINRHTLHCLLLTLLKERFGVEPVFEHAFSQARIRGQEFSTVFATDGVFSESRALVSGDTKMISSAHGNIELSIPVNRNWPGALDALHVWPADDCTLIGFPCFDGSVSCTLQIPIKGPHSQEKLMTGQAIESFMKSTFPDVEPFIDGYVTTLMEAKAMPMVSVKCGPWHDRGKLCLMGDSAHAVFPSLGQGANCAFEDALIMDRLLIKNSFDFATTFSEFEALRKRDSDALHDMSLSHYELLRSPSRLKEEVRDDYYERIAFSNESYACIMESYLHAINTNPSH